MVVSSVLLWLEQMLNSGGGIWNDVKPEVGGPNSWNVDIFVQVLKELVGATVYYRHRHLCVCPF